MAVITPFWTTKAPPSTGMTLASPLISRAPSYTTAFVVAGRVCEYRAIEATETITTLPATIPNRRIRHLLPPMALRRPSGRPFQLWSDSIPGARLRADPQHQFPGAVHERHVLPL